MASPRAKRSRPSEPPAAPELPALPVARSPSDPEAVVLRGALLPLDGGGYGRRDVLLGGGRIRRIAPPGTLPAEEVAGAAEADCAERMLLPGFLNGHTHSTEHWVRGLIRPLPLELWVLELIRHEPRGDAGWFGADSFAKAPPRAIGLSALLSGVEALLSGCTAVLDHVFIRGMDDLAEVVAAYRALGLRAFVAPMLNDDAEMYANYIPVVHDAAERNAAGCCGGMGPAGALRERGGGRDAEKTARMLALWEEAAERFHDPENGVSIVIGPVTAYSASPELLRGAADIRRRRGLLGHTHLLETRAQALMARQLLPSGSAVRHLRDSGFLQVPGTTCAHCVWLDEEEMRIMAECGAAAVHCPLSNLRLGSGVCPLGAFQRAGVTVALGCDGSASSDGQDMLEVLKLATTLQTATTPEYRHWPHARDVALRRGSAGGYAAVGMRGKAGELREGTEADLTLWDLSALSMLPRTDPIGLLVLGSRTQAPGAGPALTDVWVRGRRIVRASEPVGVDLRELRRQLAAAQPAYRDPEVTDPAADPGIAAAEREYRAAMGLERAGRQCPPPQQLRDFPEGRVAYDPTLR